MDINYLIKNGITQDRIDKAKKDNSLELFFHNFESSLSDKAFDGMPADIGIIGAGDFSMAFSASFKSNLKILIYDKDILKSKFSEYTRISTNKTYKIDLKSNIHFTDELKYVLKAKFIMLGVPAGAIPWVVSDIKAIIPETYTFKQYVLVSKGFIRKGYLPHKWLEREGIPFENIIWASGGNVARNLIEKKGLKIAVVSINKNRKNKKLFSSFFNHEYLVPEAYSGSALLACELGGILKNYYAGLGRYMYTKYGEKVLKTYKELVRSEFRKAVRILSKSPKISLRAWVIRKASHGPSFWEDLDVTIKGGRNGFFGELIFNGEKIDSVINKLGLVESFNSIFSSLSIFNEFRNRKKLYIISKILSIYEELHMQYIENKDSTISNECLKTLNKLEKYVLSSMSLKNKHGFSNKIKNLFRLN